MALDSDIDMAYLVFWTGGPSCGPCDSWSILADIGFRLTGLDSFYVLYRFLLQHLFFVSRPAARLFKDRAFHRIREREILTHGLVVPLELETPCFR